MPKIPFDESIKGKEIVSKKITIAIPLYGNPPIDFVASYMNLEKPNHYLITTNAVPIDTARNDLVKMFLVQHPDSSHLLFWDSDTIPPPDGLKKLWRWNKPIVSGLYFRKVPPFYPVMSIWNVSMGGLSPVIAWEDNKLIPVDGVGMGFCLIRRDIFQALKPPWFSFNNKYGVSEDFYFCLRVKEELGEKIWVDTSCVCKHASNVLIDKDYYSAFRIKELTRG